MKKAIGQKKTQLQRTLAFEASEFATYQRSLEWYGLVVLFFGAIVYTAVRLNDLRLAFIIILSAIVFYSLANTSPKRVTIELNREGVRFRNRFYDWNEFKSFALIGDYRHLRVALYPLSRIKSPLVIPVPKAHGHPTTSISHNDSVDSAIFIQAIRMALPERLKDTFIFTEWLSHFFKF